MHIAVIALACVVPAAHALDFAWTTNADTTITISGYTGPGGSVVIPDTITGLPVSRIGQSAFQNLTNLTSVTIPNSVISIGDLAFAGCTDLTSVEVPESVGSIGIGAFANCSHLTSLNIPEGVTDIAFGLFESCSSLTNIPLPTSLIRIGEWAFFGCTSLQRVTIPENVSNIGLFAFNGCTNLTAIEVDPLNSVYSSLDGVLFSKSQTMLVRCPEGKAGGYSMPNNTTHMEIYAFYFCRRLTNVTFSDSLTSISYEALRECTALTNVTIGKSVTSIGAEAFRNCTGLISITIPSSVVSIGDDAFHFCPALTGIYCEGSPPALGLFVFENSYNVTVYYLPGTVGWGPTYGYRPTALWGLPYPLILASGPSFGVQTNRFGFTVSWATNLSVVVEACTDLANPIWSAVGTNTLTSGSSYFSDPDWTNYPGRLYRLRSP